MASSAGVPGRVWRCLDCFGARASSPVLLSGFSGKIRHGGRAAKIGESTLAKFFDFPISPIFGVQNHSAKFFSFP
jgi:hypothetical protein